MVKQDALTLRHDAPSAPNVNTSTISPTPQQDVRSPVPERDDLVRKGVDGYTEGSGETEVGQLEFSAFVDEEVLRFQVSMEDSVLVTERRAFEQLRERPKASSASSLRKAC